MIPNIIHAYWDGCDMPEPYASWHLGLIDLNPDAQVFLWTQESATELLEIPEEMWASAANQSEKSDIVRWYAVNRYGGVYTDTDVEWYKPVTNLLQCKAFISQYLDRCNPQTNGLVACVFGAEPGHNFAQKALQLLWKRKDLDLCSGEKFGTLGDHAWHGHKDHVGDPITILPPSYFFPYSATVGERMGVPYGKNSPPNYAHLGGYAAHHWVGSWVEGKVHG
jgi:hypothetical protein